MSRRRNLALGAVSCGLALGGYALSRGLAEARQNAAVVVRFELGYFDATNHFVPTAGRGATNVDRNAIAMFLFSGPMDLGPNLRATLPLTLEERDELATKQRENPDYDPSTDGIEFGETPRKRSDSRATKFVATGSVNPTSVQIGAPQPGGNLNMAVGQFFKVLRPSGRGQVIANRLTFNPRFQSSTYGVPQEIDYNARGFEASTEYEVYVDGGPNPLNASVLLRNSDGLGLAVPFSTTFTTTDRYVQDFTRPQVRQTTPVDKTDKVESDADIELTFSEPMNVASFVLPRFQGDDAWTAIARYTDNPINGTLLGRNLLLQVRTKPETGGEVIQLRPLQGFGKGPFEIEVIVRNGVTDLSGNNIVRQINFTFKTAYDADADQAGFLDEKFDNKNKEDTQFQIGATEHPLGDNVVGTWNGGNALGFLTGTLTEQPFVAASPSTVINRVNLFGVAPLHFQNLYNATDMGARARTITGMSWRWYSSSTFNGLTYPNTFIQMGHAADSIAQAGFPGPATAAPGPSNAYFRDTPIAVVPTTTYVSAGKLANGYVGGPPFAKNFNSDGAHSVILDINHGGNGLANDYWQCDAAYLLPTCTFANNFVTPPQIQSQPWYFDTKFTYLTPGAEAQSLFYDIGRDDERILPQQVVPISQPQGTSVTFLWQGASSDPLNPTKPDPSTYTNWLADVRQLSTGSSASRFLRFRVTMLNNLTTKAVPAVDTVSVPYTYK